MVVTTSKIAIMRAAVSDPERDEQEWRGNPALLGRPGHQIPESYLHACVHKLMLHNQPHRYTTGLQVGDEWCHFLSCQRTVSVLVRFSPYLSAICFGRNIRRLLFAVGRLACRLSAWLGSLLARLHLAPIFLHFALRPVALTLGKRAGLDGLA